MPLAKETSTKLTYICITAEKLLPLTSVNCANCQSSHQSSRRAFWIKKKVKKELLSCLILSFQISQLYSWTTMLVGKCDDDKLPYCPQFFWGAMFTQTVWQQQQQLLHRKKLQTCREQAQPALNIGSPGSPATDSRLMIWTFQPVPRVSKTKFFWRHLSRLDNV